MSNAKYNYDENSETWPYFAITLVSVLVIPSTISSLTSLFSKESKQTNGAILSSFKPANLKAIKKFQNKFKASKLFNWKNFFLVAGWALLIALGKYVANKEIVASTAIFDPFEILGVAASATDREIKSHYRKLSIKFHPDKLSSSLSADERNKAEEAFVLINKAYKALTDDTTKENFAKYGHPDGPQAITQGIALPKFLIESQGPFLVVGYVFVIAVLLPFIVRYWWNNVKSYTKKGIRTETADILVEKIINYKPTLLLTPLTILEWIIETPEIKEGLPKLSREEILDLFVAHTNRKVVENEQDKLFVISQVPTLINGLIDIAAHFRNTDISLVAIDTLRCIIQAVPLSNTNKQQLLQLPNVDAKAVEKSSVRTLGKLFTLSEADQKKALGIKDTAVLKETLSVAANIPVLKVLKAEFKVPGEDVVAPGSISHIVVKLLVKSPTHHGVVKAADVASKKLEEEDTFETLKDPFKIVKEQPRLPPAYSPYFPAENRASSFISLLALQKDGKLVEQPEVFTNLDLSNLALSVEQFKASLKENGKDFAIGTFKVPLTQPAPPKEGNYEFRLLIKSADYYGADLDIPLVMSVKEPTEKVNEKIYEVPAPDEDSIAGTMAQLRGEPVTSSNGNDDEYFDSEDEEELVEGANLDDEDDDWSDIDTDTDEEDYDEEDEKTK